LLLRVTSFRTPDNTLQRLLVVAIFLLATGVFWSLWLVRDLMKKRTDAEDALRAEHAFRAAMEDSLDRRHARPRPQRQALFTPIRHFAV
jgi:two-component system sensor histidine kinase DctS